MELSDIVNSDQQIMLRTTVRDGMLSFTAEGWGPPLVGKLDKALDRSQIIQWCNAVRSSYRARQDRQEDQKASPAPAVPEPHLQPSAGPVFPGGSGVPVQEDASSVKASMEAGIESALAELARREGVLRSTEAELTAKLEQVRGGYRGIAESRALYLKMKKALEDNAPKVRK